MARNQINCLCIEGNLVEAPVYSEPLPGFKKASYTIGCNSVRLVKGEVQKEVSFIDCEAYGNTVALMQNKNLSRGSEVRIVGRLKQDTWKKDDKTVSKVYIVTEHIDFNEHSRKRSTVKKQEPELGF